MAIPVFRCADLEAALGFYVHVLGATVRWRDHTGQGPGYAALEWRGHELHLSSHAGDGAPGAVACLALPDVDEAHAALLAAGWTPRPERGPVHTSPTDQTWGLRELYVVDPDGNVLRLQGPIPG